MIHLVADIFYNRQLLWDLTKRDLRERYIGSYLGILWAFIQPMITICIFWFVFQVGFKTGPTATGTPYILWLVCGMFPWFFFSDSVNGATNSIIRSSFLVKKIVFPVRLLPIVQIFSAGVIHCFFIVVLFLMFAYYNYYPSIYNLQIIYYSFAAFALILGISWLTSSLSVFSNDVSQFVNMCLQFLFWLTPIMWDTTMIPEKYSFLFKLNPLYYIVRGYRDSFIDHCWFWERGLTNIYFWVVTLFIAILGAWIFKKLYPHFADVL
jgi:lipopolysaccharide transport system permease protein/teichoic acid transport system permease protein